GGGRVWSPQGNLTAEKRSRSVPTLTFDLHRKRAYAKIIKSAVGSTVIRRTFDVKLHEREITHYHRCNYVSIWLSCAMRRENDFVQLVNILASRPKFPYQDRKMTRLNYSIQIL